MAFFDELSKKAQSVVDGATEMAKDAAGVVTETAKKTADLVKTNAAIIKEQHEMDKNYKTIGEWFVNEFEGEIPEAVQGLVEAVAASKAKIAELEESKSKEEEVVEEAPAAPGKACPICGAPSDSKFCPQCGAPMGE